MTNSKVVTRFAPSPTGFLHIGGARTALFNYYFAKHNGGSFLLRIEDTDKKRSTQEATQAILDGMAWLGLHHDGDIVYQSQHADTHQEAAQTLLKSGHAYRCYLSAEEQEQERLISREQGRAFRSPYRDPDFKITNPDASFVVRFRVPDGTTVIHDEVQGKISWANKDFDDLILLRADGSPVYMLAVVVDDHSMGITHIVRGDDHLVNAGRQSLIYQALNWDVPVFAHVPLIFGPDGKKLSKRHGALGVDAYADMGYLPAGLRNYLTRLGWAHGDLEIFTDAQAIEHFELSGINNSPARLDFEKMAFINGQHMKTASVEDLWHYGQKFFEDKNEGELTTQQQARLTNTLPHIAGRAKTMIELAEQALFVTRQRPISLTGKAKKPLKADAEPRLRDILERFKTIEDQNWNEATILDTLTRYTEDEDIGFGKIGAPLRACLTGGAPSPDLALVLELIGKNESIGRIEDCLNIYYKKINKE
jgi:glutamyl-tRNA synthetase